MLPMGRCAVNASELRNRTGRKSELFRDVSTLMPRQVGAVPGSPTWADAAGPLSGTVTAPGRPDGDRGTDHGDWIGTRDVETWINCA